MACLHSVYDTTCIECAHRVATDLMYQRDAAQARITELENALREAPEVPKPRLIAGSQYGIFVRKYAKWREAARKVMEPR